MSERNSISERRKKNQRQQKMMLIMIVGGLVIVVGALLAAIITSGRVTLSTNNLTFQEYGTSLIQNANTLGDPDAPVVIEEYSDFGCIYCANFALGTKKTLEQIYITNGQVKLVFHSVGGMLGAPSTVKAAEAAYCAGDQESFWPYHDLIFNNQVALFQNRGADITPALVQIAKALELNLDEFESCLRDGKYSELAEDDELSARQNGITGTPAFIINGVILRGNQPLEAFQQVIDEQLASATQ
jgi:protein-disulfide isomerase